MASMGKVRIYDLAKELKLESKKVLEDARRLGVDVSVPSNTLPDNIAAKIREMYYPKKEPAAAPRTARLIKHPPAPPTPPTPPTPVATATPATLATPVAPPSPSATASSPSPSAAGTGAPVSAVLGTGVQTTPAAGSPTVEAAATPAAAPVKTGIDQVDRGSTVQTTVTPLTPKAPPEITQMHPAMKPAVKAEEPPQQVPVNDSAKSRIVKLAQPAPAAPAKSEPVQEATPELTEIEQTGELEAPPSPPVVAKSEPPAEPVAPAPAASIPTQPLSAQPAAPESTAIPAAPPIEAKPPSAPAVSGGTGTRPSGTKVIKLALPTRPMPKPQTSAPPAQRTSGRFTGKLGAPGAAKHQTTQAKGQQPGQPGQAGQTGQLGQPGREKEVHILPSGAQQRTVYIPPKDQRPKGRHQQRKDKEKEKEGQQKGAPRRMQPGASGTAARQAPVELKPVRLVEGSTVREFAERIEAKPRDIVTNLMQRGVMATINQTINPEIAKEIGRSYGFDVSVGDFEDMIIESEFEITPEAMEDTDPRAPVVTVMGHVDHGKTSLLDAIRRARVAEGEAGGITQHIGAYSVEVPNPDKPAELRRVVFLDTPGHEAFTMMRARGAKVTDIVVLVVAADDGVMPQTVEAIEHAKAAEVPIVVAINKVDKPDANPERVKKELGDRGLLWDGWGGQTTMVEVSAKKKQNIDGLLEMILLTADLLDLKANPKRMATGTVLEAKLDRGRGAVATVLIQNGTLRVGEPFIVGNYFGKVRALMNDRGERVLDSGPATPVEVLGLEGVPAAGDQIQVVDDVSKAQQISQFRQAKARATALARTAARGLDQLAAQMASGEVKELLVILKADVQGSVEVLKDTLTKLSTDKVKVRIIRSGVGAITESDVLLASATNATATGAATAIIGFNVRPETRADEIAKQEDVDIRLHSIIYKVEEEIRNAMIGMLDATLKEVVIGKAEVRDIIRVPKVGSVAGCMVINGTIKRTAQARLIRDNVVIFESQIGSLRRFKDDVSEVQQGFECGITVDRFNDFKIGDVIEAFITEKVAATKLE